MDMHVCMHACVYEDRHRESEWRGSRVSVTEKEKGVRDGTETMRVERERRYQPDRLGVWQAAVVCASASAPDVHISMN